MTSTFTYAFIEPCCTVLQNCILRRSNRLQWDDGISPVITVTAGSVSVIHLLLTSIERKKKPYWRVMTSLGYSMKQNKRRVVVIKAIVMVIVVEVAVIIVVVVVVCVHLLRVGVRTLY